MSDTSTNKTLFYHLLLIHTHTHTTTESLVKAIGELKGVIVSLREDVGKQRQEINYLRSLIESCQACNAPAPLIQTCATHNPCFPGNNKRYYIIRISFISLLLFMTMHMKHAHALQ